MARTLSGRRMWFQVLPLMRVKKLMKEEADVKAVAGDASYAAARATVGLSQHALPLQSPCKMNSRILLQQRLYSRAHHTQSTTVPCVAQDCALMQALPYDGSVRGWSCVLQEFLIEELARRAFDITAKSNRDMISYTDVGEY